MAMAELTSEHAISVATYSDRSISEGLRLWRQLEDEVGPQGWSCSTTWVESFIRHYGDFARIEVVVVSRDDEMIGAGLLCRKTLSVLGPLGFEALLNGTGGEPDGDPFYCEHHRLLAADENYAAVESAVTEYALSRTDVDAVYWSGYSRQQVQSLLERESQCEVTEREYGFLDLTTPVGFDVVPVAEWIDDGSAAESAMVNIVKWNRGHWGEVGANGYDGRYERFLTDVVPKLVEQGDARVVQTASAAVVLFIQPGCDSSVFAYLDAAADDQSLLGCHRAAALLAAKNGYRRYELAVVPARGLEQLGLQQAEMLWVRIPQSTWRSGVVFAASAVKQRLRRS